MGRGGGGEGVGVALVLFALEHFAFSRYRRENARVVRKKNVTHIVKLKVVCMRKMGL